MSQTISRRREKLPVRRFGPKVRIVPDALYSVEEVAHILGFDSRPGTVYEIPERELVPTWVGPRRGTKRFLGRDIIAYVSAGKKRQTTRRLTAS